jgi:hypothetical protein
MTNLTLDGVMQAPERPDEESRGGFQHGGVSVAFRIVETQPTPTGIVIASYQPVSEAYTVSFS